jgi:hypothetical protein
LSFPEKLISGMTEFKPKMSGVLSIILLGNKNIGAYKRCQQKKFFVVPGSALVVITHAHVHVLLSLVIPMQLDCCEIKNPDSRYHQDLISALVGIQTPNLLIRSQMLYSVELQVRYLNLEVQM